MRLFFLYFIVSRLTQNFNFNQLIYQYDGLKVELPDRPSDLNNGFQTRLHKTDFFHDIERNRVPLVTDTILLAMIGTLFVPNL